MPHGQPDYGMYAVAETIYRLTDMGELAVRLGSIVTYDRRGDVIWFDDFEDNINKWFPTLSAGTGSIDLSAERARNGGRSAKLVTGAVLNRVAHIQRPLPLPAVSKIGFEVSFCSEDDDLEVSISIAWLDGTYWHLAQIIYDREDDELRYVPPAGLNQVFATSVAILRSDYCFHTAKLVMDPDTYKYVRFLLDSNSYDLSAYSYYKGTFSSWPYLYVSVGVTTREAAAKTIYVDDAIVTQNEP